MGSKNGKRTTHQSRGHRDNAIKLVDRSLELFLNITDVQVRDNSPETRSAGHERWENVKIMFYSEIARSKIESNRKFKRSLFGNLPPDSKTRVTPHSL